MSGLPGLSLGECLCSCRAEYLQGARLEQRVGGEMLQPQQEALEPVADRIPKPPGTPIDDTGDAPADHLGWEAVLLVMLDGAHDRTEPVAVGAAAGLPGVQAVAHERGGGVSRLDKTDTDPERLQLHAERLAHRLDRILAGAVDALERDRVQPGKRPKVDDRAEALPAHLRNDLPAQPVQTPEVDVEEVLALFRGGFIDGAGDSDARIVHQDIDALFSADDLENGGPHRLLAADIHSRVPDPPIEGARGSDGLHAQTIDPVPRLRQAFCRGLPEAAARARNDDDLLPRIATHAKTPSNRRLIPASPFGARPHASQALA